MGQNTKTVSVSRIPQRSPWDRIQQRLFLIPQRSPWDRIQQWCLFLIFLRGLHGTEYNNPQRSPWDRVQQRCLFLVFLRCLHGTEYNNRSVSRIPQSAMGQNRTTGSVSCIPQRSPWDRI